MLTSSKIKSCEPNKRGRSGRSYCWSACSSK